MTFCMYSKVTGLNVRVDRSEPGGRPSTTLQQSIDGFAMEP